LSALFDFVEDYETRHGREVAWRRGRQFMAEYLKLLEHALPLEARDALAICARYERGEASAKELTAARVRCWQAPDAIATSTDLSLEKTCARRAAICFLLKSYNQARISPR